MPPRLLVRWFRTLLASAACLALAPLSAHAEEEALAGRWMWSVEGRPVVVLEIGTDDRPSSLTTPEQITQTLDGSVLQVAGPVKTHSLDVRPIGANALELVEPSRGRTYVLRLVSSGSALLSYPNAPIPPMAFYRIYDPNIVMTDWGGDRAYERLVVPDRSVSNPELLALFEADQAPRQQAVSLADDVERDDRQRRVRVRQMLDEGLVQSGDDYLHAAFIFQHGDKPNDFLLAHALATTAVAKGNRNAAGMAAQTLDRYLQSIGKPQIYGTQFQIPNNCAPVTQGDFDQALIPDSAREALAVPPLAGQQEQRQFYAQQRRDCPPAVSQ